jgi:hypothetical protein
VMMGGSQRSVGEFWPIRQVLAAKNAKSERKPKKIEEKVGETYIRPNVVSIIFQSIKI